MNEVTEFTRRLDRLGGADILAVASAIHQSVETVDGEVTWWRSTAAVAATLRSERRCREASIAARSAGRAVVGAAERTGLDDHDHDAVILVARAAADAARALVAGEHVARARAALLAPFGVVAFADAG